MTSIIHQNQTVSMGVYIRSVSDACPIPHEFLAANHDRISRAYEAGEPVWMIADEMKLRYEMRPRKTPRQLAVRVVKVS